MSLSFIEILANGKVTYLFGLFCGGFDELSMVSVAGLTQIEKNNKENENKYFSCFENISPHLKESLLALHFLTKLNAEFSTIVSHPSRACLHQIQKGLRAV